MFKHERKILNGLHNDLSFIWLLTFGTKHRLSTVFIIIIGSELRPLPVDDFLQF